jgi:hypothetical protein
VRWEQGRPHIEGMLERGEVQRVHPSRVHAELLIGQADVHLASAAAIRSTDPTGAYQLLYDASRKALVAVLQNQGLRPTSRGGHIAVFDAVSAQLDPPLGTVLRSFDRMRRRRNQAEYPSSDHPAITGDEVESDLVRVGGIVDLARRVIDQMGPY